VGFTSPADCNDRYRAYITLSRDNKHYPEESFIQKGLTNGEANKHFLDAIPRGNNLHASARAVRADGFSYREALE